MGPSRRGEAWRRLGRDLLLLALVSLGAFQVAAAGIADDTTVEPAETPSGFAWKPASVTTAPGGSVAFRNPGTVVTHGVHWTGGPEKPSCSGVPVDDFGTSWSGACTFAQAGNYSFVCTVHPEEMKGTITVASGETSPAPGSGEPPATGSEGPLVETLQLARRQHGGTVRGAITIGPAAVGGRFTVELRAVRSALSSHGKGTVRIGELQRGLPAAGRLAFGVPLRTAGRRALQERGHLALTVNTIVRPPSGTATEITRRVKLSD